LHFNSNHLATKNTAVKILTQLTASMSVISLIQKVFNVGLGSLAASYIGYYRKISYFVFGFPAEFLNIHVPTALIDFWTLSFICAGAYVRTKDLEKARAFRDYNFPSPSIKLRTAVFVVFGLTGIGLTIPLSALSIQTYTENDITRDALKNFAIILAASLLFFALNAFAPSA
jgi:hypothetical protein